jgi:hypothetical protein
MPRPALLRRPNPKEPIPTPPYYRIHPSTAATPAGNPASCRRPKHSLISPHPPGVDLVTDSGKIHRNSLDVTGNAEKRRWHALGRGKLAAVPFWFLYHLYCGSFSQLSLKVKAFLVLDTSACSSSTTGSETPTKSEIVFCHALFLASSWSWYSSNE